MRAFGSLLVRGLIVGLFAGLLAGAFAFVTGEPRVDAAIAIEEAGGHTHSHAQEQHHHEEEEPLVSRDGQRAGLFLATSLYGVALGGLFAVAYTMLRRKLRTGNDAYAALGLAAAGFVGVVLVPFLKYPPNPPAVGDPDTITRRTVTYLLTLVIGLLAVWAGVALSRWAARYGDVARLAGGVVGLVATVVAAYLILPRINEVPETFPATLLWQFRFASLGTQATLWLLLGFGYAVAVERRPSRSKVVAA
jgi:predicted cobalt transporter CbtA